MRTGIEESALKTSEKFFIGIWIVTVILIFALLTAFSLLYQNQENPNVTEFLKTLDRSVDPCEDFYKFVCGADAGTDIIEDEFKKNLSQVLNATIAKGEWKTSILAKKFYKSCLNSGDTKDVIINQLNVLGGWPVLKDYAWNESSFMWIDLLHKFRQEGYMEEMLMKFEIVPYLNNSEYIVQISPPQLYITKEHHLRMSEEELNEYLMLMVNISVSLGANRTKAKDQLQESLEFEVELANLSSSSTNQKEIMQISNLQSQYQSIQWLTLINGVLLQGINLTENSTVAVVGQKYFFEFQDLMAITSKRVQANYMFWRILIEKIKYFPKATYDIYSKSSLAKESRNTGEQDCAVETYYNMPYAINSMYYFYYFYENKAKNYITIVNYLKQSLRRIILDLNWMDSSTKAVALNKLNKTQIVLVNYGEAKIGNYYKNLTINEAYFKNALQVYKNARDNYYRKLVNQKDWIEESIESVSYLHTENRIFVPATILQSPSYKGLFPMYLNFGSLGWIVGSEIIRGFYDTGKFFDDKGNAFLWWSKKTEHLFEVYKQCIKSSLLDKNVNDSSIIDMQIAHNLGIKLAYSAYYNWLKTQSVKAQFKNEYSSRQLFWISAAKVWCAATQNLTYLDTDNYPSNKHTRVIESFRNSEEFSAAFNCPKGSKMNPTKKCL